MFYPFNAKKVDILLYPDRGAIAKKKYKKFSFVFSKLLHYFILLINPNKIFSGKYKCQFVVNDIIICDNRYPTLKSKNQIYNIIYLIPKNKKIKYKIINKPKKHLLNNNSYNTKNIININININHQGDKLEEDNKNEFNRQYCTNLLKKSLEDIKEEDDEGKSLNSSSRDINCEKIINEKSDKSPKYSIQEESDEDDDDFDFTYEELLKLKYKKK